MGDALPVVNLGTGRTAKNIAAGQYQTCVIVDDDTVKCWGSGGGGALGLGDVASRGGAPGEMGDALPVVNLGTGRTARGIAVGESHSCALLDNGDVKCWGFNLLGELGLGDMIDRGDNPGEMGDALPPVYLGAGRKAKRRDGRRASVCRPTKLTGCQTQRLAKRTESCNYQQRLGIKNDLNAFLVRIVKHVWKVLKC